MMTPGTNEVSVKLGVFVDLSLMAHCVQSPLLELKSNIKLSKRQRGYTMYKPDLQVYFVIDIILYSFRE